MLILPQVISNLVIKKEINSDGKKSLSSKQKGVRQQKEKKSQKNVELTLDIPLLKINNKAPCKNIHKAMKQRNKSKVKHIKNGAYSVKRKSLRIQQRDGKGIGIEDDRQLEATTYRNLKRQANTKCESFVETLTTKVLADEVSETNEQNVDEDMVSETNMENVDEDMVSETNMENVDEDMISETNMENVDEDMISETIMENVDENKDSDSSEELDESSVSNVSYCSGSIFCDCKSCKDIGKSLIKTKLKPVCKYVCGLCKKRFLQKSQLMEHKKGQCDSSKPFSCALCAKGFDIERYVTTHMHRCHSTSSVGEKTLKFKCVLCNKYLCSNKSLTNHKMNKHFLMDLKHTNFSCALCPKAYKYLSDLRHHEMQSHGDEKFECGHCPSVFKSKRYLNIHMQRTHFATIHKCSECPKTLSSALALKKHLLSYHSDSKVERGFICETCGKCLSSKSGLKRHISTHTGEKSFICQVCGKSFRTDSNLYQHSRTHSDERNFSCELCPKAFRIKHHLRQHMAVHGMAHTSVRRKQRSIIENE